MHDLSKIIYSVDKAEAVGEDPAFEYEGWISPPEGDITRLHILGDGHEEIPSDAVFFERRDIQNVIKDKYIQKKPGFIVSVKDIEGVIAKHKKIGLYVICGDSKKLLLETDCGLIKQALPGRNIQYCIDNIKIKNGRIGIIGWAVNTGHDHVLDISLCDNEGNAVDFEIKKHARPDVNSRYDIDIDKVPYAGFDLELDEEDFPGSKLFLKIKAGKDEFKDHVIDLKEIYFELDPANKIYRFRKNSSLKRSFKKKYGRKAYAKYLKHLGSDDENAGYMMWSILNGNGKKELKRQKKHNFEIKPLFSIVVPLYNTPIEFLKDIIDSVRNQSYTNLELCLTDGSEGDEIKDYVLSRYVKKDRRIKYKKLERNLGISTNTNEALKMASGDYIVFADHDDILAPNALFEIVSLINETDGNAELIYTAEDKVSTDGEYCFDPVFKQKFNPDFLRSNNYICHMVAIKRGLFEKVGFLESKYDGAQDHAFLLRCIEKTDSVYYIPKVLYHWRAHKGSTALDSSGSSLAKSYAYEAGAKAIKDHYERLGFEANVSIADVLGIYRSEIKVKNEVKVSVIIINKDSKEVISKCVKSVCGSSYENKEVLIADNKAHVAEMSDFYDAITAEYPYIRIVVPEKRCSVSELFDLSVKSASGEYYVLLDSALEIVTPRWIEEMLGYCQRRGTGIVGARLYNIDGFTCHLGVILNSFGLPEYMPVSEDKKYPYNYLVQDVFAVSESCMMIKKEAYKKAGGSDENLTGILGAADLCMAFRKHGYLTVIDPYAEMKFLTHRQLKSKDYKKKRKIQEKYFSLKWEDDIAKGDPYIIEVEDLDKIDFANPTIS